MATHGTLNAFNPAKEQWTAYAERLNYYFIANGVKNDAQKCAIFYQCVDQRLTKLFAA